MREENMKKKGQITVFIILGIVIVLIAILLYFFYPSISLTLGFSQNNPSQEISECIQQKVIDTINELSIHGGSVIPTFYYTYQGEQIEYLCYTNQNYLPCIMQRPMLKEYIEREIKNNIINESNACFDSLEKNYARKGYAVDLKKGAVAVEILPEKTVVIFNHTLTLKKEDTDVYKSMNVVVNNNLYELVNIVLSILNFEATYGDSETTVYMDYYRNLNVEKKKQSDGTTIYRITNRDTQEKFQFASRSIAWPPGY
jgi:hypothetical protein